MPVLITCMQCGRLAATTTGGPPGGREEEPRSWKKRHHRFGIRRSIRSSRLNHKHKGRVSNGAESRPYRNYLSFLANSSTRPAQRAATRTTNRRLGDRTHRSDYSETQNFSQSRCASLRMTRTKPFAINAQSTRLDPESDPARHFFLALCSSLHSPRGYHGLADVPSRKERLK